MSAHLVEVSIRSLMLALPAAIGLWLLRSRRTAALQHAVWATVVFGMLALFAFGQALPRLPLRILDRPAASAQSSLSAAITDRLALDEALSARTQQPPGAVPAKSGRPIGWQDFVLYTYGTIAFAFLAQFVTGVFLARRLLATAHLIPDTGRNDVYESELIAVPVTVGLLRPRIVLPLEWREWEREKLDAVLAHEGAHVQRRDGLVAALAGVNRCIFWFHPLAWMVQRKLALLAEQACDDYCVAGLGDRERYARVLLEMAGVVDGSQRRLRYHALTMAASSHIRRRIESLLHPDRTFSRGLTWTGWAAVMVYAIPAVVCAGAVDLDHQPPLLNLEAPRWAAPPAPSAEVLLAQVRPTQPTPGRVVQVAQVQAAPVQPSSAAAVIPKFDSVTVKPCGPGDGAGRSGRGGAGGRGFPISPPGELYVNCLSVWELIHHYLTFGNEPLLNDTGGILEPQRVRGGPPWLASDYYTIDAKTSDPAARESATPGSPARRLMHGPMLKALLEDRFQLRTRRVVEEVPMYALVVAESGFRLQPMEEGGCIAYDPSQGLLVSQMFPPGQKPLCISHIGFHGPNWTLRSAGQNWSNLAHRLGSILDRPVLDKTGITGSFIIQLEFARDRNAPGRFPPGFLRPPEDPSVPLAPSVFTVLEQLGLKLVNDKGPREHVVIDNVQRPSMN